MLQELLPHLQAMEEKCPTGIPQNSLGSDQQESHKTLHSSQGSVQWESHKTLPQHSQSK